MARARRLLAGALFAVAIGGVAQSSQPEIPAIKVVYFQTNSARPEAPDRLSSTLAAVAEQAKSFQAKAIIVVPEGAMVATSATRKRVLDERSKIVVNALVANGVAREVILLRSRFGEGIELYEGDPARSAELNGVSVFVVANPAIYAPPFRPMMPEPTPLPAPSKLPEVHLDDH